MCCVVQIFKYCFLKASAIFRIWLTNTEVFQCRTGAESKNVKNLTNLRNLRYKNNDVVTSLDIRLQTSEVVKTDSEYDKLRYAV